MKIQLISHSCVIVETVDCKILADPWIVSKAFNNSWTLFPAPCFEESMLADVDYLWISHEHPDHFNIPSLRILPEEFRSRVTVLFQKNNSQKLFEAFGRLGYPKHRSLPHSKVVNLTEGTEIFCYQVGQMDSALGIRDASGSVLNLNDANVNASDAQRIRRDFGECDTILKQFSIAGYGGFEDRDDYLPGMATGHIDYMLATHRDLKAKVTIPFASFVLFSAEDNRYVNDYANTPNKVAERFAAEGLGFSVLEMGDVYDTAAASEWDSQTALSNYAEAYASLDSFEFDVPEVQPLESIKEVFERTRKDLVDRYPGFILGLLKPVTVRIPDLDKQIRFSIKDGRFDEVDASEQPDLIVNSQPLHFALSVPFGVQTLGVSARVMVCRDGDAGNWLRHRNLLALYNAEVYLRPKYLFTSANFNFLWSRRRGLMSQLKTRFANRALGR